MLRDVFESVYDSADETLRELQACRGNPIFHVEGPLLNDLNKAISQQEWLVEWLEKLLDNEI